MKTFDHILLLGRPAAGKSEFIDFMKKLSDPERAERFHIGKFEELDDHPWIWEKFIEDNLWEESGCKRLYSHKEGNNYGLNEDAGKLLDFMFARFNRVVKEKYLSRPEFYKDSTLFIEFARGREDAYKKAFSRLDKEVFKNAAIFYVDVSFEESWRRNLARYEEKLKHSILAHMATRRVMEYFYQTDDWAKLTGAKSSGVLEIHDIKVPFVTMPNEPESTDPKVLTPRYSNALNALWKIY